MHSRTGYKLPPKKVCANQPCIVVWSQLSESSFFKEQHTVLKMFKSAEEAQVRDVCYF